MDSKAGTPVQHLRHHLGAQLLAAAGRESRGQPPGATEMTLRQLVEADPLAHVSASNILETARCSMRDLERVRAWGAGLGLVDVFVSEHKRLPLSAVEIAEFAMSRVGRMAT
jgi:hypothetical protein